jgi:lipopolysaccharide/colanic/teichoic acid biosynthesis glycosyltransferase
LIVYLLLKRLFDICCSALGLVVLSPLGLLLGLWVKLSDGGPVLYGQQRVGRLGRPFRIWKFRTMVANADKLGLSVTRDADPRITRVGRFLRKTKLDELPQLWNVLRGEMSFVGPRPEVPRYVALYTPEQREVLRHRPGITDLASLEFRDEEALLRDVPDVEAFYIRYCLPRKIELHRQYAARAGFFQDLGIILRTVGCVAAGAVGMGRGVPGAVPRAHSTKQTP